MHSRIARRDHDTAPLHDNAVDWLTDFTIDLQKQLDADQPLRLSDSQLMGWSAISRDLERCVDEHYHYGFNFVHKVGEAPFHGDLILKVSLVVAELRLRNEGHSIQPIGRGDIHEIAEMIPALDKCRKRIVFR